MLSKYTSANVKQRQYQIKCAICYFIGIFLIGTLIGSLGPSIPLMAIKFNLPLTSFGSLFSCRGVGYIIGSILCGKYQQHYIYLLGTSILGISSILVSYVENLHLLCLIFFFLGFGCSLIDVLSNVLIVWVFGSKVDPWMQAMHFCFGLGSIISPVCIALFGYQFNFFIFGFLTWLMCFYLDNLDTPQQENEQEEENANPLIDMPKNIIYIISFFLLFYVGFEIAFGGWIPSYTLLKGLIISEVNAAYGTTIFWSAITVGRLSAIPLSIKFHKFTLLKIDLVCCFCSCLFMIIFQGSLFTVYFGGIVLGLFMASIYPCAISFPSCMNMKMTGQFASTCTILSSIGEVTIPYLFGLLMNFFGPDSFIWTSFIVTIILGLLFQKALYEGDKFQQQQNTNKENNKQQFIIDRLNQSNEQYFNIQTPDQFEIKDNKQN